MNYVGLWKKLVSLGSVFGTGAGQVAAGNHAHSGTYDPAGTAAGLVGRARPAATYTAMQALTGNRLGDVCEIAGLPTIVELSGFADDVDGDSNSGYFILRSRIGNVTLYANVTGQADSPPEGAGTAIKVEYAEDATAATIQAAFLNAIGTRTDLFSASAVTGTITVSDSAGVWGSWTAPTAMGGTLAAAQTQAGLYALGSFQWDSVRWNKVGGFFSLSAFQDGSKNEEQALPASAENVIRFPSITAGSAAFFSGTEWTAPYALILHVNWSISTMYGSTAPTVAAQAAIGIYINGVQQSWPSNNYAFPFQATQENKSCSYASATAQISLVAGQRLSTVFYHGSDGDLSTVNIGSSVQYTNIRLFEVAQ